MNRILTVQDISCVGKCSLTVALPIISAMGTECAILPTAVLSTHTAFGSFTCEDLTHTIEPSAEVWKKEKLTFDCIYTGYLATAHQIGLVCSLAKDFASDGGFLFVDPAMGDYGKLYKGFDADFPSYMAKLCDMGDVIVPNLTEACAMLGIEYREDYTDEKLRDIAKKLCDRGAKQAVITGYSTSENDLGVLKYDSMTDTFFTYTGERVKTEKPYHGTGDVFASVAVGGISAGMSLEAALTLAADFTAECVKVTESDPDGRWYGVSFEKLLRNLDCMMRSYRE